MCRPSAGSPEIVVLVVAPALLLLRCGLGCGLRQIGDILSDDAREGLCDAGIVTECAEVWRQLGPCGVNGLGGALRPERSITDGLDMLEGPIALRDEFVAFCFDLGSFVAGSFGFGPCGLGFGHECFNFDPKIIGADMSRAGDPGPDPALEAMIEPNRSPSVCQSSQPIRRMGGRAGNNHIAD